MTPFPLETYREGMAQVVEAVWDTMLGLALRPADCAVPAPPVLTGAVYYAGAWKGAVLLECSERQAADWSARLMSLEPPLSPDDLRDGLGELANIIAGNLKPLLPPGVGLSLPSVVQGADYSLRFCGGHLTETVCFADSLGSVRITLVEVLTP